MRWLLVAVPILTYAAVGACARENGVAEIEAIDDAWLEQFYQVTRLEP